MADARITDLSAYAVDTERGFVPASDPLAHLPKRYAPWERLANNVPVLVMTGRLRAAVDSLSPLPADDLTTSTELERAMLVLSVLGSAYMWAGRQPVHTLPAGLAMPWCEVAAALDVPPIVRHSSLVLQNWRRLDPAGPLDLTNLDARLTFLGGIDEKWFYLATLGVELAGAAALPHLVQAQHAVMASSTERLIPELIAVSAAIHRTTRALLEIGRWCAPNVFYHRVRPWLAGWPPPGVVYEGVDDTPRTYTGGSAAQSSLVQALDAGLGVAHPHTTTGPFLRDMRAYMPAPHRRFLADLEAGPSVFAYVAAQCRDHPRLGDAYGDCIRALADLRSKHIGITARYIGRFVPDSAAAEGTGGTNFVSMLRQARDETRKCGWQCGVNLFDQHQSVDSGTEPTTIG